MKIEKGGMNFIESLQLLLIALRLMGFIRWPMFWVLSPFLIEIFIFIVFALAEVRAEAKKDK